MSFYSTTKPPRTSPLIEWARAQLVASSDVQDLLGVASQAEAEDVVFLYTLPAERPARLGVVREMVSIDGKPVTQSRRVYAVVQVEWHCHQTTPNIVRWHEEMYQATFAALMGKVPSGADLDADLKMDARRQPSPPFVVEESPQHRYTESTFSAVLNPTA